MIGIRTGIGIGVGRQGAHVNQNGIATNSEDGVIEALYTDSEDGTPELILINMEDI